MEFYTDEYSSVLGKRMRLNLQNLFSRGIT